ncbi:LANO_0C04280g1_1 [Lachancea nothofagi CBS 11611]|uniref:LANO_0C04280g1_1 n=1 Tax=Lachancea nothofagi CBS 11611 TaxID=1266666 RepID=A0A1G4J6Q6_9SACH|nr:LANO_0C04280g1_1 [Lachancea nothofagi CBS 11611]
MADSSQPPTASTSAFVSTLIFYGVICLIFIALFVRLRPRQERVYQPRSIKEILTVREEERSEPVPAGYFAWVKYLLSRPHSYVIQHAGLDGYLFLRFIAVFGSISLMGCLILLPILLPVNATNGNNYKGFELLAFANVTNKNRFYAHVFLSWIFFGLVLYTIYRELYYYVSLRHAVQTSPLYDGLVSSRTVILTDLSSDLVNESEIQRRFQNCSRVVFAHDNTKLQKLVQERTKLAGKYEGAMNKVIQKSLKIRAKAEKKGKLEELIGNKPEDDLQTYIPLKKRPTLRLGKIPLPVIGGKKYDTLEYCSKRIGELNDEIAEEQQSWDTRDKVGSCFMEFKGQLDAQRAFQSVKYILDKGSYDKCVIGVAPQDVAWNALGMSKKVRASKRGVANTVLTFMIIFWAIPVAVVGFISNINFLIGTLKFLSFINNLPKVLLGLITGVLPTVALAILMSLVPIFIKKLGAISGCTSLQEQELYCQVWYYSFLVVQVFIVVTLTSSASSTVSAIIDNPSSAMTLLAAHLPASSNFYIAYFLLQGLTFPSGALLQIVNLILSKFLGRILDSTPRQKWNRYNTLSKPTWGVMFPNIELLLCILICYSIIAPIILVFSTFAFGFFYLAYQYNLNYVLGFSFDMKGRNYARALFQVFLGLYLSEICLLGLFIMAKTWGPLVIEVVFIVFTVLCHLYFQRRFIPLFDTVPLSAIKYARGESTYFYPSQDQGLSEIKGTGEKLKHELDESETGGVIQPATSADLKKAGILSDDDAEIEKDSDMEKKRQSSNISKANTNLEEPNFVPEDEEFHKFGYKDVEDLDTNKHPKHTVDANGAVVVNADAGNVFSDAQAVTKDPKAFPPNKASTWSLKERVIYYFKPHKSYEFSAVRRSLPYVFNTSVQYDKDFLETAYTDPSVTDPAPKLWIARDSLGLSTQQVALARTNGVEVSDEFTGFDEKNRITYSFHPPDFEPVAQQ